MRRVKIHLPWSQVETQGWLTPVPNLVAVKQAGPWWWVMSLDPVRQVARWAEPRREVASRLAVKLGEIRDWSTWDGRMTEELIEALVNAQHDFWLTDEAYRPKEDS